MRTLLLLRGAMGSGKSTWIKENNLEPYTLEADKFRMLVSNPVLNEEGDFIITQKNDRVAWDMLLNCLEARMQDGHFTVIDATHNSPKLCKKYEELADKYKYSIFYYQPETSLEECLARQYTREEFKKVPKDAIRRAYSLIENVPLSKRYTRINELKRIDNFYVHDIEGQFKQVKIFGDIHGCYTVLQSAISSWQSEDNQSKSISEMIEKDPTTLYVFVGDYIDRGIENWATMKELMKVVQLPNAILLEGNHDIYPYKWAIGEPKTQSKSPYFLKATLPELLKGWQDEGLGDQKEFAKEMKRFYKKLRQAYAFKFNGQKYLVTHGGLTSVPKLAYVSSKELIKGVGDYETDVGKIYDDNYLLGNCQDFIQLHGHRGVTSGQYSYCLESEIEFGGFLSVATLTTERIYPVMGKFQNTVFKERTVEDAWKVTSGEGKFKVENEEVNKLLTSRLISSKAVEPNLISINFKEMAFRKKAWNDLTIKARGLFVDKVTGEVKMRSFNKFFNYGEVAETQDKALQENLAFPLKAWVKYNGFLGIMSVVDGELVLASKKVTSGEHVSYFKELWEKENPIVREVIQKVLAENNASLTFEVIHSKDPHIVDYEGYEGLIVLDAIPNTLQLGNNAFDKEFSLKVTQQIIHEVMAITKTAGSFEVVGFKELVQDVETFDELLDLFKEVDTIECEGLIIEDANGFLFKYKGKWYSDWKRRRGFLGKFLGNKFNFQMCRDDLDVKFMTFIKNQPIEQVENNILTMRKAYFDSLTEQA